MRIVSWCALNLRVNYYSCRALLSEPGSERRERLHALQSQLVGAIVARMENDPPPALGPLGPVEFLRTVMETVRKNNEVVMPILTDYVREESLA